MVGFGLYGSIHGPSEYEVTIQLIHTGSGRLLGSNEITFSSDGTNSTFRAMFKVFSILIFVSSWTKVEGIGQLINEL